MRVANGIEGAECEVHAIAIGSEIIGGENIFLYFRDEMQIGLRAERLVDCKVTDFSIGPDFRFVFQDDRHHTLIISKAIRSVEQLEAILELDEVAIEEFERNRENS